MSDVSLLPRTFYEREPSKVARELLGKLLIRKLSRKKLVGRIVEVEAYLGAKDPAAHAYAGLTARNAVLFGPAGHAYVYFIYGMYYCLNFSCEPEGQAGCVLLRALEPVSGLEEMARRRGLPKNSAPRRFASGPGKLCQALDITRSEINGMDVTQPDSPLQVADDGFDPEEILATPRIGIRKAADLPLRFLLKGNPSVSGR
jgi:DNA-3-methyladenine glycosylase